MSSLCLVLLFELYGDHRDLHVLTHSFPPRRSSDLGGQQVDGAAIYVAFSLRRILDMFLDAQVAEILDQDQPFVQILRQYPRSEEHTPELQSLMRIEYAGFCLKKKQTTASPSPRTINTIENTKSELQQIMTTS